MTKAKIETAAWTVAAVLVAMYIHNRVLPASLK